MFHSLHALAARGPLMMMIALEGDRMLRVTVTQKPIDASAIPLSLSVLATPAELDAELPAALAAGAVEVADRAPIADQVRIQIDAAKTAAPKPANAKSKSASKPATPKTKPSRKPAATTKRHVAKKSAGKPAPRIKLPGAPKRAAAPKLRASRPGAEACIADYAKLAPIHGADLTRELFMAKASTGRRFERVFGNWNKFVAAAKQGAGAEPVPPADTQPPCDAEPARRPESATPAAVASPAPPPAGSTAPAVADPASPVKGRVVALADGRPLAGGVDIVAETGVVINIPGHGRHKIMDFDAQVIYVTPVDDAQPENTETEQS